MGKAVVQTNYNGLLPIYALDLEYLVSSLTPVLQGLSMEP